MNAVHRRLAAVLLLALAATEVHAEGYCVAIGPSKNKYFSLITDGGQVAAAGPAFVAYVQAKYEGGASLFECVVRSSWSEASAQFDADSLYYGDGQAIRTDFRLEKAVTAATSAPTVEPTPPPKQTVTPPEKSATPVPQVPSGPVDARALAQAQAKWVAEQRARDADMQRAVDEAREARKRRRSDWVKGPASSQ